MSLALPTVLLIGIARLFLVAERALPGRTLPGSHGWYAGSIGINLVQLTINLAIGKAWLPVLGPTTSC